MSRPRLLEVAVGDYKNLRRLRAPWASAQVVYGANASGKTNLLECLVLLAGTQLATWEASPRFAHPRPGTISAVMEVGAGELPARLPVEVPAYVAGADPVGAAETFAWWEALGARDGTEFADALASARLPGRAAELVASLAVRPRIRYSLDTFATVAGEGPDSRPVYLRRYGRTLCLDSPPPRWLGGAAEALPEPFEPFRAWLRTPKDERPPHPELLELPSAGTMPLSVQWIPRTRTGAEQIEELAAGLQAAYAGADALVAAAALLPLGHAAPEDGAAWPWLLSLAANHVSRELALTLPELRLVPAESPSAGDTGLVLVDEAGSAQVLDARAVDLLSDGQRIWFDEAVGSVLQHLADLTPRNELRAHALATFDEAGLRVVADLVLAGTHGGGVDALAAAVDDVVTEARRTEFDRAVYGMLLDVDPLVRLVRQATLRLRLFDEPERHQHPRAVRRIRTALETLHARPLGPLEPHPVDPYPVDIVISTHSHLMLEPSGWSYLHMRRTPEGAVASALRPGELTAASPLAADMGLTRGELLGLCQLILFVEGIHDELVLTRLFGTELRGAGVVVLPVHGTDNLPMLPNLTLVQDYLDCPVAVLADHARQQVLDAARPHEDATAEELHLHRLLRAVRKQQRPWRVFGLSEADIVYYLPDKAVAAEVPGWPGWAVVTGERERAGLPVKRYVQQAYGTELDWPRLRRILDRMDELGLPRPPELVRVVAEILAWTREGARDGR